MQTNPRLRAGLRYRTAKGLSVAMALLASLADPELAMACEMAEVLFGDIKLPMEQDGFESAIVRHNNLTVQKRTMAL